MSHLDIQSITPAITELERIVNMVYRDYGGPRPEGQPPITVTIQTRGRKAKCLGYFLTNGFATKEGEQVHELTLTAEWLARPTLEIVATAIHETAHLYNHDHGIKDCADSGRHNKKFKETAILFGLTCEKGSSGLNHTAIGPELEKWLQKEVRPDDTAFYIFKQVQEPKGSPPMNTWKCQCEEGDTKVSIRLPEKKQLSAHCYECEADFTIQPKKEGA